MGISQAQGERTASFANSVRTHIRTKQIWEISYGISQTSIFCLVSLRVPEQNGVNPKRHLSMVARLERSKQLGK